MSRNTLGPGESERQYGCAGRCAGRLAVLFFVMLGAAIPLEASAAATCKTAAAPTLLLDVYKSETSEAFDTTGPELRQLAAAHGEKPHWPALGVYVAGLGYKAAVDDAMDVDSSGQFCATVSSVHVVITIQPRVIHLARELGSLPRCLLRAVHDHERQHARADDQALEQWTPDVGRRVRDALARLPTLKAQTEEATKALVVAAIRTQLQALMDDIQRDRDRLNELVDAPDAIVQLRKTC
jgi:hypothetical protein